MQEFYIELGKAIEQERTARKLSRKSLADILGVEQMTVYNWEKARCRIHGLELIRLMSMFRIRPNRFPKK